jgi:hypothetical protein
MMDAGEGLNERRACPRRENDPHGGHKARRWFAPRVEAIGVISPGRALRGLLLAIAVLMAMGLFVGLNRDRLVEGGLPQLYRLFGLDEEANIPAWFSAALLLCCSLRLRYITWVKDGQRDADASYWRILSLLFLFLSLDEIASFHEMATERLRQVLHAEGLFYFAWVIPGLGLVLLFAVIYSRFLRRLPRRTGALIFSAGLLYVGGAIGLEMVGGWWASSSGLGRQTTGYVLISSAEELLEMLGAAWFMYAILDPKLIDEQAGAIP